MSLPLLISLVDEASKSGKIDSSTKNYLLDKANEFGIDSQLVEKLLIDKNVQLVDSQKIDNSAEVLLSSLNENLRERFSDLLSKSNYDEIVNYFEANLMGTLDYALVDIYLLALINKLEYEKAFIQSEKLIRNIKSSSINLYPTLGQVYLYTNRYERCFEILFYLLETKDSDAQFYLDSLVKKVLDNGQFDLLYQCKKNINYLQIATDRLLYFYQEKKYDFFIRLFEEDFYDQEDFVKQYIWSLYLTDGLELKAYKKGCEYLSKVSNPVSLYYVMGLSSYFTEKWVEAFDYFSKCLTHNIDAQEDIDKLIEKVIEKKDWQTLNSFKLSKNFETRIDELLMFLKEESNHSEIVALFHALNIGLEDFYKLKMYVFSLYNTSLPLAAKKYAEYDPLVLKNDRYWLWLGGRIHEDLCEFDKALNFYQNAENIEEGYCSEDILRVTYVLNPHKYFKDLFNSKNYFTAIEVFESKLKKTTDLDLIYDYITALYKNDGTEEKSLELGVLYSKSNPDGHKLFQLIAFIAKYLKKYTQSKEYFLKAQASGYQVDEELQDINMILAKIEEEEKEKAEEQKKRMVEEIERMKLEAERRRVEEIERIRIEEVEHERALAQKRMKHRENASASYDDEGQMRDTQNAEEFNVGSFHFKSSISRGGDAIWPEHIYINGFEVKWEKKVSLFSKESTSIPIKEVTQIEIETSLIGSKIRIFSRGSGSIFGENFSKADVREIKRIIGKIQKNM
jgi:hypothetical protein